MTLAIIVQKRTKHITANAYRAFAQNQGSVMTEGADSDIEPVSAPTEVMIPIKPKNMPAIIAPRMRIASAFEKTLSVFLRVFICLFCLDF